MSGIYIHIPFCKKRCNYCDFYSECEPMYIPSYVEALKKQIATCEPNEIDSVYIGGGTPSLLEGKQIDTLLTAVEERFTLKRDTEITIEVNPDSSSYEKLFAYKNAGVNRISLGVQSAYDKTLKRLGRLHTNEQVVKALQDAVATGFTNISGDIMLGLPNEKEREIDKTIRLLYENGVTHISAYILKISEDTPFGKNPPRNLPDDDTVATLYEFAAARLISLGYDQYEISNFAKKSYESRHNKKYWNCEDYIGIGAGAYSSFKGKRYHIVPDIKRYIAYFNELGKDTGSISVNDGEVGWDDYMILRLRTNNGLSLNLLKERYTFTFSDNMKKMIKRYIKAGYINEHDDVISLTRKGFLVSNEILAELMLAAERTQHKKTD